MGLGNLKRLRVKHFGIAVIAAGLQTSGLYPSPAFNIFPALADDLAITSKVVPILSLQATLPIDDDGDQMSRYLISVENYKDFSSKLFLPATYLKPLAEHLNSSRAWVYVKDKDGNVLQTFGTINNLDQLKSLWFATEKGATPPSQVFVDIWDRQEDIHFKSALLDVVAQTNKAETERNDKK